MTITDGPHHVSRGTDVRVAIAAAGDALDVDLTDPGQRLVEDLGLDSLLLLEIVVQVEDQLGCEVTLSSRPVATVGDLVALFERAVRGAVPETAPHQWC